MVAEKNAHPHAAKHFLNALRAMIGVAIVAGLRADDPTAGIRIKARRSSGFLTWTDAEIAQFEAAHPVGSRARLAFGLLLYTGQRRGDVIKMDRQHVRDGFMRVVQQKTGIALEIPMHTALAEILAAHPAVTNDLFDDSGRKAFLGARLYGLVPLHDLRGRIAHGPKRANSRRNPLKGQDK
jgi:integrase